MNELLAFFFKRLRIIILFLVLMTMLQACPEVELKGSSLSDQEIMLLPYQNGQSVHFAKDVTIDSTFMIKTTFYGSFADNGSDHALAITFSKAGIFPRLGVSTYPRDKERGIFFNSSTPLTPGDNPSCPPFDLILPYDKNFEFVPGPGARGDTVKFLGTVQINGTNYENVYEIKQNPLNTLSLSATGSIEALEDIVIWYSRKKGLLKFSYTHLVFRNLTDNSLDKIEYLINE